MEYDGGMTVLKLRVRGKGFQAGCEVERMFRTASEVFRTERAGSLFSKANVARFVC